MNYKKEEREELNLEVQGLYDEYLQETENRGISYGEIAYIESLNSKEINDLYEELNEVKGKEVK